MGVTRTALAATLAMVLAACGDGVEFPEQGGVLEAEVDTSTAAWRTGTATPGRR